MNTEEKAKRYDEIIEKANKMHCENCEACQMCIEELIPELRESENERIRKALINGFNKLDKSAVWYNGITNGQILAWLEKQGEQGSINDTNEEISEELKAASILHSELVRNQSCIDEDFIAGAQWLKRQIAWSEEDETALGDALWCCKQAASIAKDENDMGNVWYAEHWLKSIKDRVFPQPKQEWSEEDEKRLNGIINYIAFSDHPDDFEVWIDWLKSLRPQNRWKPSDEMLKALYRAIPENTMAISEDEMLLDKLYQGLKYGRVLSNK